jgi:methionine synthase I (cobalamin-dependent)
MRRDGHYRAHLSPPYPGLGTPRERLIALLNTREKLLNIRERLNGRLTVGEDPTGTLLADRRVERPFDEADPMHAQVLRGLLEEYPGAGAWLTETNTFAASRLKLATCNPDEMAREINVEESCLTDEAVGSLPYETKDVFAMQAETLLEVGTDALLLETQNLLVEANPLVGELARAPASMPIWPETL